MAAGSRELRFHRKPNCILTPAEVHRTFHDEFPDHTLRPRNRQTLGLVSSLETWPLIKPRGPLGNLAVATIASTVLTEVGGTTHDSLTLPAKSLCYLPSHNTELLKISLVLDDKNGDLQQERSDYLACLQRMCGEYAIYAFEEDFVTDITLATVPRGSTDNRKAALQALCPHMPEEVMLSRVVPKT